MRSMQQREEISIQGRCRARVLTIRHIQRWVQRVSIVTTGFTVPGRFPPVNDVIRCYDSVAGRYRVKVQQLNGPANIRKQIMGGPT